jgi:DNA-binding transcriptional MerR regulator
MKTPKILFGALALYCVIVLSIGSASAAVAAGPTGNITCNERGGAFGHGMMLDRLEEQGYNVSAIRAAFESGDTDTARTLMQQFMEEHRDELPAPPERPAGDGAGTCDRMTGHLDRLEAQGYDVSAIRAAVESGDTDTARTLMHQFMQEHRDELPKPAGNGFRNATANC